MLFVFNAIPRILPWDKLKVFPNMSCSHFSPSLWEGERGRSWVETWGCLGPWRKVFAPHSFSCQTWICACCTYVWGQHLWAVRGQMSRRGQALSGHRVLWGFETNGGEKGLFLCEMTIVNPASDTWPLVQSAVLWVRLLTKMLHSAADLGLPCLTKATKMNAYLVSRSRHYLPHLSFPWVAYPNMTCSQVCSFSVCIMSTSINSFCSRSGLGFTGVLDGFKFIKDVKTFPFFALHPYSLLN